MIIRVIGDIVGMLYLYREGRPNVRICLKVDLHIWK